MVQRGEVNHWEDGKIEAIEREIDRHSQKPVQKRIIFLLKLIT